MRQASQASKTRVLRLKEPISVRTDQFRRIGRAEPHNPAGISAYAAHKHTERVFTQPGPICDIRQYLLVHRESAFNLFKSRFDPISCGFLIIINLRRAL